MAIIWTEIASSPHLVAGWAACGGHGSTWRSDDGQTVIVGVEDGRWHLSISRPDRLPSWREISAARDRFIPADVVLCVPFPPRKWWLNIHNFCLHLVETRDTELIEQWKYEGEGAKAIGKGDPS